MVLAKSGSPSRTYSTYDGQANSLTRHLLRVGQLSQGAGGTTINQLLERDIIFVLCNAVSTVEMGGYPIAMHCKLNAVACVDADLTGSGLGTDTVPCVKDIEQVVEPFGLGGTALPLMLVVITLHLNTPPVRLNDAVLS